MPFQLGAMHFGLALLGAWFGRRSRTIVIASVSYAILILSMLEVSRPLWESAGVVRFLQFPWRLLSVTATLQIVAAAGIHGAYRRHLSGRNARTRSLIVGIALAAWLAGAGVLARDQFSIGRTADPAQALQRFRGDGAAPQFRMLGGVSEYVPKTARERPPRPRDRSLPPFRVNGPGTVASLSDDDYRLHARVEAERAVAVVIERVYLPDWFVEVDGKRLPQETLASSLTAHGFVRLALGPGTHEIRARYLGPPGRRIRNLTAIGVLVASGLLLWILRQKGRDEIGDLLTSSVRGE